MKTKVTFLILCLKQSFNFILLKIYPLFSITGLVKACTYILLVSKIASFIPFLQQYYTVFNIPYYSSLFDGIIEYIKSVFLYFWDHYNQNKRLIAENHKLKLDIIHFSNEISKVTEIQLQQNRDHEKHLNELEKSFNARINQSQILSQKASVNTGTDITSTTPFDKWLNIITIVSNSLVCAIQVTNASFTVLRVISIGFNSLFGTPDPDSVGEITKSIKSDTSTMLKLFRIFQEGMLNTESRRKVDQMLHDEQVDQVFPSVMPFDALDNCQDSDDV